MALINGDAFIRLGLTRPSGSVAGAGVRPGGTSPATGSEPVSSSAPVDGVSLTGASAGLPPPAAAPLADEPRVPLSIADRISLSPRKKQVAQAFYTVGRELAKRVTGDSEGFKYKKTSGLTNLDDSASLWALQAKYGDNETTLKSVPVSIAAMAVGAISNVPIEGAKVEGGKLVEARASGHSLNPLLNVGAAIAAGVALTLAPPLAALALAGPLLTAAPLLGQRLGDTNAPVHEMAHAMQFMLLGDLMNQGVIDTHDMVAIQNDTGTSGYLWGGTTENAAHAAETSGDIKPMFDTLRQRVADRLEEQHGLGAQALVDEATRRLDEHEKWMTPAVQARLPRGD